MCVCVAVCVCVVISVDVFSYKEDQPTQLTSAHVRPRAKYRYQWNQVSKHYITVSLHFVWDQYTITSFTTAQCWSSGDGQL